MRSQVFDQNYYYHSIANSSTGGHSSADGLKEEEKEDNDGDININLVR